MTPVMLSASIQDTPQEVSRGKWVGFNNIFQGLGVLLIAASPLFATRVRSVNLEQMTERADRVFSGRAERAQVFSCWSTTAHCCFFLEDGL